MGTNEIIQFDSGSNRKLTFDEFKEAILLEESGSYNQKVGEFFKRLGVHFLKSLDKTGVFDFVFSEAERESDSIKEERKLYGMYALYDGIQQLNEQVDDIKQKLATDQIPILIEQYIDKTSKSFRHEKIQFLKNLVINGLVDKQTTVDEKVFFMQIVEELSFDQLKILVILYWAKNDQDRLRVEFSELEFSEKGQVACKQLSQCLNFDVDLVLMLCSQLIGRGLIIKMARNRPVPHEADTYLITEPTRKFVQNIQDLNIE